MDGNLPETGIDTPDIEYHERAALPDLFAQTSKELLPMIRKNQSLRHRTECGQGANRRRRFGASHTVYSVSRLKELNVQLV